MIRCCSVALRRLLPIALLLLVAAGAALAGPYVSQKGYEITPASGWMINNHNLMGTDLVIYAKPANGFAANINVIVSPCPSGITLDQLRSAGNAQLRATAANYKTIYQGYTTIDGTKALLTLATHEMGTPPRPLYMHQDVVIKNGYAYTFTCTALQSNHAAYDTAFTQMLKSIRWRTPTGK